MAGELQPLSDNFAIVDTDGRPTIYFIQWAQERQIDITAAVTADQALAIATDYLATHTLHEGSGIQITPSGNLSDNPTIAADVQEILDQVTTTRGSILYRGLLGWASLAPGTATYLLTSAGAGADPIWAAPAGGGVVWGGITGVLSAQADLQAALDTKLTVLDDSANWAPGAVRVDAGVIAFTQGDNSVTASITFFGGNLADITAAGWELDLKGNVGGTYFGTLSAAMRHRFRRYGTITGIEFDADPYVNNDVIFHGGNVAVAVQALLNTLSTTRGTILYRGAAAWAALAPGAAGDFLQSGGAGANPSWITDQPVTDPTTTITINNTIITIDRRGRSLRTSAAPLAASFTLAGAALLTLTDDPDSGLAIDAGALAAGDVQRIAYRTLTTPANDWDYRVNLEAFFSDTHFSNILCCMLMDSVGGKIQAFGPSWDGTLTIMNLNGLTGFSSNPFALTPRPRMPTWWRATKVGAVLTYYVGPDGKNWTSLYVTTPTTWMANNPNRIGFGVNYNAAAGPHTLMSVKSLSLTGTAV